MKQEMSVDEALLVADEYPTGGYNAAKAAMNRLAAEVRRQRAEIESFCMEYRMKCDAETKAQAVEIERLGAAVKAANSQAEHFEREWYLRGDEIEALHKLLKECEPAVYSEHMGEFGTRIAKPGTLLARVRAAIDAAMKAQP